MRSIDLSAELEKETYRLAKLYRREARRCIKANAHLAGCILIGAALEATLLLFANCYTEDIQGSTIARSRKIHSKPLEKWSLAELLVVAKGLDWLPSGLSLDDEWSESHAKIGDYAEVIRKIRNLVHPTCYSNEMARKRITKRYYKFVHQILDTATDHLLDKIHSSLKLALALE